MRYTVRTPDGELTLPSRGELERAFAQGLVGPEDEVQEEGSGRWRKAASLPGLHRPESRGWAFSPRQLAHVVGIVGLGMASLLLLLSGTVVWGLVGALLAFSVVGWLFVLTQQTFTLRRKR